MKASRLAAIAAAALAAGCASDSDKTLHEIRLDAYGPPAPVGETPATAPASTLPKISGEIRLLDAINYALSQNLPLRAAFLMREEAAGAITEAKAAAYPHAGLTGGVTSDLRERGDNPDTYGVTWSITQPLWRSGAVSAGIRYAELYSASTDEAIRRQVQETVDVATRDFLGVLLAQQMVNVYTESAAVAERMLETAQKKRNAGSASDYEVLRAEVEVASTRAELIKERNALRSKVIRLLQTMGVNQESDVTLVGSLAYRPEQFDLATLVQTALVNRPDLLQAEAALRMADEKLRAVKGSYGPSADAFLNGKYQNPDPNDPSLDEWSDDWSAGLQVTYTLFDGLERKGRLIQAKSVRRQAEANLRNAEEAARVEIHQALLDLRNAEELYQSQAKNIDLSREALRMLENGHKVGKNTQIEVLDARSALTEAMGQYYNAIYSHLIARLAIRRAIGTLAVDASEPVDPSIRLDSDPL